MQKIALSTGNKDKIRELTRLVDPTRFELFSKDDLGLADFDVEETGETLRENADLKVEGLVQALKEVGKDPDNYWILADDTGLFVDALDGAPGVYSARYAGDHVTYDDNVDKLLHAMEGVEETRRGAHFSTVIAFWAHGTIHEYEGRLEGHILTARQGKGGFGYDPIFFVDEVGKSLAELSPEEKNKISHRGRAYRAFLEDLHA